MFAGIPAVSILMVTDNCLDVTANWSPLTGECSDSQFMITLLSDNDNIVDMTSEISYTFDNTVTLTGDISVSVVAINGNAIGTSTRVDAQPSLTSKLSEHQITSFNIICMLNICMYYMIFSNCFCEYYPHKTAKL